MIWLSSCKGLCRAVQRATRNGDTILDPLISGSLREAFTAIWAAAWWRKENSSFGCIHWWSAPSLRLGGGRGCLFLNEAGRCSIPFSGSMCPPVPWEGYMGKKASLFSSGPWWKESRTKVKSKNGWIYKCVMNSFSATGIFVKICTGRNILRRRWSNYKTAGHTALHRLISDMPQRNRWFYEQYYTPWRKLI